MNQDSNFRRNPSRATCEQNIHRILMTELMEHGSNSHFKSASDFMSYFEALYPASDALTKQVQRAIKSMNMPRDEKGYYIVNKTQLQFEQDKEISTLFQKAHVQIHPMDQMESIFLSCDKAVVSYLIHILESSESFQNLYLTFLETSNGILIYTDKKEQLLHLLNCLTI